MNIIKFSLKKLWPFWSCLKLKESSLAFLRNVILISVLNWSMCTKARWLRSPVKKTPSYQESLLVSARWPKCQETLGTRLLQSQSKLLGHFCVSMSPQCWCIRFADWTAINNFERDKGSTRRKKTASGLSVPTIFVWECVGEEFEGVFTNTVKTRV